MAHFGSFHRIYIATNDIMTEDDDMYHWYMAELERRTVMMYNVNRSVPRVHGYLDVVADMSEEDFRQHFRVSRHMFEELLEFVSPYIVSEDCGGNLPLPPRHQLSVSIWYLSNQESMREASQLFGISMSTVHAVVVKVCDAVLKLKNHLIRWPDEQHRVIISDSIQQTSGFPGVVGFLDGTHIRLTSALGGDNDYYNRKGYPSMQLQLVVDPSLMIISAFTGWPGCTHDARVLRNSQLFQKAEQGELFSPGQMLFSDNAYPLRNWLISPFKKFGNVTQQQRQFNTKLSGLRQTVERGIGHLKGRFRRLREIPLHNAEQICKLIIVGCICHNLCVLCEDDVEIYIQTDGPLHPNNYANVYQHGNHGVARRLQLLNLV